jgi:hypothetical protein
MRWRQHRMRMRMRMRMEHGGWRMEDDELRMMMDEA